MVAGLGRFLDQTRIQKALVSIYNYNFKENFYNLANVQRTYALAGEKGLLLCTWPRGGRPPLPFPYSDEVWTGIEYQVASHLMYEGLLREGLTLVKAVRERYDGRNRNPWDEVECGHHYARAMSSWGSSFWLCRVLAIRFHQAVSGSNQPSSPKTLPLSGPWVKPGEHIARSLKAKQPFRPSLKLRAGNLL